MLPNQLDAEGRNLITLAAQRNQEALMLAILGSAHAEEYGLKVRHRRVLPPRPLSLACALHVNSCEHTKTTAAEGCGMKSEYFY